ncbi:hypothetical protein [Hymenobacter sp. CRA2]|uniref:hypothetical protein n=1 Tax=Hymenobacter sp. CRA2 TaxID=1955620 RepID=UPI00098F4D6E|nr:hypothetical protein [Hymenobacter sp. CRA2]OON66922.1 hypothetical protein B0919_20255 [Hymenobacter sp. CRA2]
MAEPILVIHGVANRDKNEFLHSVAQLQTQLGAQWELLPVFWGDLGGVGTDITDCLPVFEDGDWHVRSFAGEPLPALLPGLMPPGQRPNAERAELIAAAASPGGKPVRGVATDAQVRHVAQQELPDTKVLQHLDDAAVFRELGETIRAAIDGLEATQVTFAPAPAGGEVVRMGGLTDEDVRGILDPVGRVVKRVIHSVDEILGRTLSNRLGQFNQNLRAAVLPSLALFFGDIIVYQRDQQRIQQRIWEALAAHGQGYGSAEKPIHAVAHSLGGVITFDAAVQKGNRLHLKSFTTFGSQAAFFHIVDRRTTLDVYSSGQPVKLPDTIGRWTNLWDTADLLAFTASTVFRLHDGSKPKDIPVLDPLSRIIDEKAWMHSVYWGTQELLHAIRDTVA